MSSMTNVQSYMQEIAKKTKEAENQAKVNHKEEHQEQNDEFIDLFDDPIQTSNEKEDVKSDEAPNKVQNKSKQEQVDESVKDESKKDARELQINQEDLPFPDIIVVGLEEKSHSEVIDLNHLKKSKNLPKKPNSIQIKKDHKEDTKTKNDSSKDIQNKGKIKITRRSTKSEKDDIVKVEEKPKEVVTSEVNQQPKDKKVLNSAGREIKVYKKYPKFLDRTKEFYTEEDLDNPNLSEDDIRFVQERLKEQAILSNVEKQIALKDNITKNKSQNSSKSPEKEQTSLTLDKIPKDEYEIVEKCDIGQITEEQANKIDGEYILIPAKEELNHLFRISGSSPDRKDRWMELVKQAWESDKKTLTNKKIKNGKFRLDKDGMIEILPDHETRGLSSKELLKEHWRI